MSTKDIPKPILYQNRLPKWQTSSLWIIHCSWFKKVLKVSIIKIRSLFVSLSVPQFYRATTLRTPRELPEIAKTEKVRFVKNSAIHRMALYIMGSPRTSWVSGECGGTCRSNVDGVNNHCDHVAECEVTQPYGYRVVPYRVGTTADFICVSSISHSQNVKQCLTNWIGVNRFRCKERWTADGIRIGWYW